MNPQFAYYNEQGLYRSIDIFNFPKDYPAWMLGVGFRYLWKYNNKIPKRICPSHDQILEKISKLILAKNIDGVSQIFVDLLLEISPERGKLLLNELRQAELKAINGYEVKESGAKNTIYGDNQTVHNNTIKGSVD